MNISKADILNPDSDNAAVKLALAETHVIQETKTYLESHGVILSSFSSSSSRISRSETTILVKNIPYGTTSDQIRELFEVHGELVRVLVPPAGTMAVVEFVHADEATKAFKGVAYRRLGSAVIYLEKGPVGIFADAVADNESRDGNAKQGSVGPVTILEDGDDGDGELALAAGTTLFIKNISFSTTTDRLIQIFRNLPSFSFARVQTKPDPKHPRPDGPRLSMGYGFVGFKTVDAAKKALKSMQGFVLDGHALTVKFAGRGAEENEGGKGRENGAKSRTTKMIVKNVPFEATKKDIRELFRCALYFHLVYSRILTFRGTAHMANSNLFAYRRNSTPVRAASHSWNLLPVTKQKMPTLHYVIHICLVGTWCLSGQKRLSWIWIRSG
jgi:multiple RNA-binding domain-containing protein 1